jgi:hypothetical protein
MLVKIRVKIIVFYLFQKANNQLNINVLFYIKSISKIFKQFLKIKLYFDEINISRLFYNTLCYTATAGISSCDFN